MGTNTEKLPPLILIFSPRSRIRDILSVGFIQCHYKITQATNSNIASLKANQFAPDLIIADITPNNTKDILMVNRLKSSARTKNIPFLAIVPSVLKERLEEIASSKAENIDEPLFHLIEYPFGFSALLDKTKQILRKNGVIGPDTEKGKEDSRTANRRIEARLFDMNIPIDKKLQEVESLIQKHWAFPFTVIKALDIIGSETSCCKELAKCIDSDLSVSSAVLKVVNTVYYAKRNSRSTDMLEAVVRLGFKQTRNLIACFSLIDLTPEIHKVSGFTRPEFWMHSLCVAYIAQKLCEDVNVRKPQLAFYTGLLHDLGKIPLDNNFKDLFPKLLEETTSRIDLFYKVEKDMMNFTHADLGHYLLTKWNLPSTITVGVLNHHKPDVILNTSPVADRIIHEAVYISNQIAKAMNFGHSCDEILQEIPQQMLNDLNIPKGPSDRFITSIIRTLNQMSQYLNIPIKKMTLTQPAPEKSEGTILFIHGSHAEFNPIVMALRHNGYTVQVSQKMLPQTDPSIKVIISLPETGVPLDIVLYDDDQKLEEEDATLKIFIMDVEPQNSKAKDFADSNMIFINQDHLDMRLLLNILDKFYGKVISGEVQEIDEDERV